MDCRYCDIQVEITKRAYAARCPDPVGVLEYIREKMKMSTRPRVDLADMKRLRQPPAPSQESSQKEDMTKKTSADSDALTSAAKAIGTTLGKIAVKTGIAKPPAAVAKVSEEGRCEKEDAGIQGSFRSQKEGCSQEVDRARGEQQASAKAQAGEIADAGRAAAAVNAASSETRRRTPSGSTPQMRK